MENNIFKVTNKILGTRKVFTFTSVINEKRGNYT